MLSLTRTPIQRQNTRICCHQQTSTTEQPSTQNGGSTRGRSPGAAALRVRWRSPARLASGSRGAVDVGDGVGAVICLTPAPHALHAAEADMHPGRGDVYAYGLISWPSACRPRAGAGACGELVATSPRLSCPRGAARAVRVAGMGMPVRRPRLVRPPVRVIRRCTGCRLKPHIGVYHVGEHRRPPGELLYGK